MASAAARVVAPVRAAFGWWVGELAGLVPRRLRQGLATTSDRLVLAVHGDSLDVFVETTRSIKPLERIDLGADSDPQRQLASLLRQHGLQRALREGKLEVCLRVEATWASRTNVTLPLLAESNLDEVLSYELDRHTPFKPDQARFAHRVVKRDGAAKRLEIELTVVPRRVVEDAVALAARLDIDLDRVDVAADEEESDGGSSGNLLPAAAAVGARRGAHRLSYALGAAAAVLAIVAVYLPIVNAQRGAEAAAHDFAGVKQSAERAGALEAQIEALRKDERFILDRRRNTPSLSKLLDDTTTILPDDTWLAEWQLHGGEIQFVGVTASASALVGLLEQSHRFRDTTFRSPVTRDTTSGRDRFHIAVQIVEKGGS